MERVSPPLPEAGPGAGGAECCPDAAGPAASQTSHGSGPGAHLSPHCSTSRLQGQSTGQRSQRMGYRADRKRQEGAFWKRGTVPSGPAVAPQGTFVRGQSRVGAKGELDHVHTSKTGPGTFQSFFSSTKTHGQQPTIMPLLGGSPTFIHTESSRTFQCRGEHIQLRCPPGLFCFLADEEI